MNSSTIQQRVVNAVELEKTINISMTCGQNMERKIAIGSLDYESSSPKLAKQSDRGKGTKYGNSGPLYVP
jgi:hypothetical protein